MAAYQLTATDRHVIRTADNAWVPNDPDNYGWVDYQAWLAAGNVPDPYVPPPPVPPQPSTGQTVLYEHENRIRALEGQPPLTLVDFITKAQPPPPQ